MPKISVIVPIYKVEQYLENGIKSILAQTYTDYEIILVDDGSPDSCGKICDEYAEKYSNNGMPEKVEISFASLGGTICEPIYGYPMTTKLTLDIFCHRVTCEGARCNNGYLTLGDARHLSLNHFNQGMILYPVRYKRGE